MLHPRYTRYFKQIIPFGVIWLIFGIVYVLLEVGLLGNLTQYPTTGNPYNFKFSLLYTSLGAVIMGFIQGWIEVVWLRKRFDKKALWLKILIKSTFYLFFIFLFLLFLTVFSSSLQHKASLLDDIVINDLVSFMSTFSFWSIIIYIAVVLNFALFFSEISEHLGDGVLYNFLLGRYHNPNREVRIFMFLDMKSSTTIAEEIGHRKYFELLKSYYADMTNAILETSGEIYQYVGDEIVVSWTENKGVYNNNCIHCFHKIDAAFKRKNNYYLDTFGIIPSFKAGYHIGEVTTGEIGIIKRDIIYTGDILNTAARIQGQCNNYDSRILISKDLKSKLDKDSPFLFVKIGALLLRGKTEAIELYGVD